MRHTHHRLVRRAAAGPRAGLALLVVLLAVAALLVACSAQATTGGVASTTGGASASAAADAPSSAKAGGDSDYARVLQILASMKANQPAKPVVVLLGGSAARESTVDDKIWRTQIEKVGGPAAIAWNLGSHNRTLAQNVAIVKELPKVPTIVYIGINLGCFTSASKTASITVPTAGASAPSLKQPHQYTPADVLSTAKKKALVQGWLADRYPVFKRNFSTSASVLQTLIKACQARHYYAVLLELPRNTAIIGSALNAPTNKYRATCQALAKKYHVPWVSFVAQAKLPNSTFYDLWHLVPPGRSTWQTLLSAKTAKILNSSAFSGSGS